MHTINTQIAVVTCIACILAIVCSSHAHISSIPLEGTCCTPDNSVLIEDKLIPVTA